MSITAEQMNQAISLLSALRSARTQYYTLANPVGDYTFERQFNHAKENVANYAEHIADLIRTQAARIAELEAKVKAYEDRIRTMADLLGIGHNNHRDTTIRTQP